MAHGCPDNSALRYQSGCEFCQSRGYHRRLRAFALILGVHVGAMIDVYGPAPIALSAGLTYIAAFGCLLVRGDMAGLVIAYAFIILAQMALTVSSQTLIAESSTPQTRDQDFGNYSFWLSGGMILGPVIAGIVADSAGFRNALLLASGLGFPITAITLFTTETAARVQYAFARGKVRIEEL